MKYNFIFLLYLNIFCLFQSENNNDSYINKKDFSIKDAIFMIRNREDNLNLIYKNDFSFIDKKTNLKPMFKIIRDKKRNNSSEVFYFIKEINFNSLLSAERKVDHLVSGEEDLFGYLTRNDEGVSCIFVDEAQFLKRTQVDDLLHIVIKDDIPVMCYGLRLNFRQDDSGFEGATRLLQIAHKIEEIKTICDCGHKATLNCRFLNGKLVTEGPDILIDDGKTDIQYRALCQNCYYRLKKES
jgi:thymidine kinase